MNIESLNRLRQTLSVELKNGLNFTLAAAIVWIIIFFIWRSGLTSYDKSVLTFMTGALMLPFALLFGRLFKATLKDKNNPLQPLGLWLNFSQLFYFPILVFTLIKIPDYFLMVLAIITGAHFFPYAWFYKAIAYAVFSGVLSIGAMFLALYLPVENMYFIAAFMSISLFILTVFLYLDSSRKISKNEDQLIVQTGKQIVGFNKGSNPLFFISN